MFPQYIASIVSVEQNTKQGTSKKKAASGFLLGLFFGPVDGGDVSLRNVWLSSNYTALNPEDRTPYFGYRI
jgi:hypothetical protein